MMTPRESFDQALKASIRDPYDSLLSFEIDPNGVTLLQLQADLLRDEAMFENLLTTLRADLPTHFLHVSLQSPPNNDYNVDERFAHLQESLQNVEGMQIERVPYQENVEENDWEDDLENGQEDDQEKGSSWKKNVLIAGGVVGGVIAGPLAVVAGVTALGFTGAGIAAGSAAATIMSSYGGAVTAGSFCAVAQSIGAAGLSAAGTAFASTVGGIIGGFGSKFFSS